MPDNKKSASRDRGRVAAERPYELSYFMRKHKPTEEQARKNIKEAGNSREQSDTLATKVKKA